MTYSIASYQSIDHYLESKSLYSTLPEYPYQLDSDTHQLFCIFEYSLVIYCTNSLRMLPNESDYALASLVNQIAYKTGCTGNLEVVQKMLLSYAIGFVSCKGKYVENHLNFIRNISILSVRVENSYLVPVPTAYHLYKLLLAINSPRLTKDQLSGFVI